MAIKKAYAGEDVPLVATFTNPDTGDGVAADSAPTVTITNQDDTEEVSAVAMTTTFGDTGQSEYVWDTDVDASGAGTYTVEVTGEFGSETKIVRDTIELQ